MPVYTYVLAVVDESRLKRDGPGAIRFETAVVTAVDAEDAYALGAAALNFKANERETANDFVIESVYAHP
jgi:hypothetical protein